jgi:hypothetical protein
LKVRHIPHVLADQDLLELTLELLFSFPYPTGRTRTIEIEPSGDPRLVVLRINISLKTEFHIHDKDLSILACQIGMGKSGGFLNWKKLKSNSLEISVGLPMLQNSGLGAT